MNKIFYLFVVMSLMFGCAEYNGEEEELDTDIMSYRQGNAIRLLVIGDSRGDAGDDWPLLPYTVLNVAIAGSVSDVILQNWHYVDEFKPDYILMFGGVNDYLQKVSPDTFLANVEEIEKRAADAEAILMIAPQGFNPLYNFAGSEPYKEAIESSPNYFPIGYVPVDFKDFCHLSEMGYVKVSAVVLAFINSKSGE